jgi:hypothetical protein
MKTLFLIFVNRKMNANLPGNIKKKGIENIIQKVILVN